MCLTTDHKKSPSRSREGQIKTLKNFGSAELFLNSLLAACRTLELHLVDHGRLFESHTSAKLTQDPCALVFFLESAQSAIDRFVVLDNDSDHCGSILRILVNYDY